MYSSLNPRSQRPNLLKTQWNFKNKRTLDRKVRTSSKTKKTSKQFNKNVCIASVNLGGSTLIIWIGITINLCHNEPSHLSTIQNTVIKYWATVFLLILILYSLPVNPTDLLRRLWQCLLTLCMNIWTAKKANVRMDYSSAFSTFVPSKSVIKLKDQQMTSSAAGCMTVWEAELRHPHTFLSALIRHCWTWKFSEVLGETLDWVPLLVFEHQHIVQKRTTYFFIPWGVSRTVCPQGLSSTFTDQLMKVLLQEAFLSGVAISQLRTTRSLKRL